MINRTTIQTCFTSLLGWRASTLQPTCFPVFSAELLASNSGLFINDIAGITPDMVNEIKSKDELSLNSYLEQLHKSCSIELINRYTIMLREKLTTKALLSNFNIGTRLGDINKITTKRGRFVGFEIKPKASTNIRIELTQIGVQFDTAENITIYFYSSNQNDSIKTFTLGNTTLKGIEFFTLVDFIASYISKNSSGDTYYLGYYENDLIGNAVETFVQCGSCGNSPKKLWSRYMHIAPIEIQSGDTFVSRELPVVENAGRTTETFGLHLKVNATCDVTSVICDNKLLFSNALQKSIAIKIFWESFNSDKLNRKAFINKEDSRLMAEKLEMDLEEELKTIALDFSSVDEVCLPCKRRSIGRMILVP